MESSEETLSAFDHDDPLAVAGAVRRCGERLRAGDWDPSDLPSLVGKIADLAKDARALVRQSVAEVTPYLPEPAYQAIIGPLAKDRSPYVRDAAEHAVKRRTTLRRAAAAIEEHDARVDRWYREIDRSGARAIARRIAAHETEYFVRRMCHEAESSFLAVHAMLGRQREMLDAPDVDRAALRDLVDRVEERFRFFEHVLKTARTHARPVEPSFQREDVATILAGEASLLRERFANRAERIAVDLSGVERPLLIDADAGFLREAFGNILKNAVEAYGDRDVGATQSIRVTVTASAGPTDATVTIRDYGCGMPEHEAARAFVPFGSSKPGGTGFGLFLARRAAVAVHGGALGLASALGEGTTVTMTLPLRQERSVRPARGKKRGRA
jgi:signal transduction histidine kinase